MEQAIKWGRPTFTVSGDWHHLVCAIAATEKGAKAVFHKGVLLEDPENLLRGSGRYVREAPAATALRRPEATAALVRSAIAHRTDMIG
ncbi:MAG: DUF1801 domain-containing protein [Actinomadura sp.]